jgi:hypothetical protein
MSIEGTEITKRTKEIPEIGYQYMVTAASCKGDRYGYKQGEYITRKICGD